MILTPVSVRRAAAAGRIASAVFFFSFWIGHAGLARAASPAGRAGQEGAPAAPQSPPGTSARQEEAPSPYAGFRIQSLTLEGVTAFDGKRIRQLLATRAPGPWPFGRTRRFDTALFDADIARVATFYEQHGYPEVEVSRDVNAHLESRTVDLTIRVREGPPTLVASVSIEGADALSPDGRARLLDSLPVRAGEPAAVEDEFRGAAMVLNALENLGYAYSRVDVRQDDAGPRAVGVAYEVSQGPRAVFGPVTIVGNDDIATSVIRRALAFREGEPYTRRALDATERRLRDLGVFDHVAAAAEDDPSQPAAVPIRVAVSEGPIQRTDFSLGYGTDERVRADAAWSHADFLGGARLFETAARWSSIDRGVEATLTQPFVLPRGIALTFTAYAASAKQPAYRIDARGLRAGLMGRLSADAAWMAEVAGERDVTTLSDAARAAGLTPEAIGAGDLDGALGMFRLAVQTSTVPLAPRPPEGHALRVAIERAGPPLPGTYRFFNLQADGRVYRPLGSRATLASRLQIGMVDPLGPSTDVPVFKRYFLGGADTLRGWSLYEVGPLSSSGLPVGGASLLQGSVEARVDIRGPLAAAAFLDAGNVWSEPWRIRLGDLLADTGAGLRVRLPFGVVRVDVGYQLTPRPVRSRDGTVNTSRWRTQFSFGESF